LLNPHILLRVLFFLNINDAIDSVDKEIIFTNLHFTHRLFIRYIIHTSRSITLFTFTNKRKTIMFNLAETENARIINLTQHPFNQDQLNEFSLAGITAENIIDTNDTLKAIITFTGEIDVAVIQERAQQLSQYISQCVGDKPCLAMVGGAPFFQMAVNVACLNNNVLPLAAYSERVSVETVQADESVAKQNIFKHKGFIPCNVVPNGMLFSVY